MSGNEAGGRMGNVPLQHVSRLRKEHEEIT